MTPPVRRCFAARLAFAWLGVAVAVCLGGCAGMSKKITDEKLLTQEWELPGKNGKAVLLVHGIDGLPLHMWPLAQCAQRQGYHCRVILLPGHGAGHRDLRDATAAAWREKLEREYDALAANHDDVTVIGFSLGAGLTLQLCQNRPVRRAVVIAPPVKLWSERIIAPHLIRGLGRTILKWLPIARRYGTIDFDGEERRIPINRHYWMSTRALLEADKVVQDIVPRLPEIRTEMLLIHADRDLVLDSRGSEIVYQRVNSSSVERVLLPSMSHTLFLTDQRAAVVNLVDGFLRKAR